MSAVTSRDGRFQLSAEKAKRQCADALANRRLDDIACGAQPRFVARGARHAVGGGPSAVAVHDDSEVRPDERRVGLWS